MQINNFKRLQEEEERIYQERHERNVRSNLLHSLGVMRFVGQVVDMYLPKIFELFVMALGGKSEEHQTARTGSTPPSQAASTTTNGKRAPGSTAGEDIARKR